jgi:Leucine-rich repeat (LRR) protein
MPDPHSHSSSRKLGGIPQDEDSSPDIYGKSSAVEMQAIEEPPKKETKPRRQSPDRSGLISNLVGLLVVILVISGLSAYYYFNPPPQLTKLLQPRKWAPRVYKLGTAPKDMTPLPDASQGYVWLFDEAEWRSPGGEKNSYEEGMVHVGTRLEKPQPSPNGEIRARVLIRENGGLAGVFMRNTPQNGRYRLAIDSDLTHVRLVHEGPNGTQELGKHRFYKYLDRGGRITLELRAQGDRISATVNGERVIEADDSRSKEAGTWGVESTDAWFELVEVPIPTPKNLIAEAKPAEPAPAEPVPMPATPAPAEPAPMPAAGPQTETGKWLATMEPQWQTAFDRDVTAPYDKSVGDLKKQMLTAVESGFTTAQQGGNRDEIAFFRGEKKRLEANEDVPMTDEPIIPPSLVRLRTNYRTQLARVEKDRGDRARMFFARVESLLAQRQALLARSRLNEEAAEVKLKRDQLAALWIKPAPGTAPAAAPAPASGMPATMAGMPAATPAPGAPGATPAPGRPPLGTAPAMTYAKMPPRQVVEKLLSLGATVSVVPRNATAPKEVKEITDLPGDRFTIVNVDFGRDPNAKPVSTEDFAILEALHDVTDLGLRGPGVTDAVMEKLRGFRQLSQLNIEGVKATAASAPVLGTLPNLKSLTLRGGFGDEFIKALAGCRKLERLSLYNLPVGDTGLAPLGKLPALEELDLTGLTKLTSTGFAFLAECRLKRLNLSGSAISSNTLEWVGKCNSLENLSLAGNPLKDDQIAGLSTLGKLKTLNLSNTGIIGTGFATWPVRTGMVTLNLTNQPGVDDAALKAIGSAFPKLESLDISAVPLGATQAGFASIGRMRNLRTLRVSGGVVNDEIMSELAKCSDLQSLHIPGGRLAEAGAASLARLSKLTQLDLDVPPVSDEALKSLARCRALKTINIGAEAPPDVENKLKAALSGMTIRRPAM